MKESDIESRLRRRVREAGGVCWKWVSPGRRGVPDRIVVLPGGIVAFVELKAPGKMERASQEHVQGILRGLGCRVFSGVDSFDSVDAVMWTLENDMLLRKKVNDS